MSEYPSFSESLKHGWNAFRNKDPSDFSSRSFFGGPFVPATMRQPDLRLLASGTDQTLINSIINRIAVDTASVSIEHIKTDENGGFLAEIDSGLNNILTLEANIDQSASAFRLDLVTSLLDDGSVACIPIDTNIDPLFGITSYDINTMRVGKIVGWHPKSIDVEVYNEETMNRQTIAVPKSIAAIIMNPFYNIMNAPNSTLKRLNRRMTLLDASDEKIVSPKLDMIIQLPYSTRHTSRESMAKKRQEEIATQLKQSEYGISYIDGTEKIIQLNRAVENNLVPQIEYLTKMLFDQLGLTPEIMNGTADEQTMNNYNVRIVDQLNNAITGELKRKYLSKTARSQMQTIWWHREPFSFTTTSVLAEVTDKFTRNEVLAPNEIRSAIGYKPVRDGKSDELRNRNISQSMLADPNYGYAEQPYDDTGVGVQ